jgi:hypothetical protein
MKADIVLSKFDTVVGSRILYSLQDRDYLVIIKTSNHYKEYVLSVDSVCNVTRIKAIDHDREISLLRETLFP